MPREVDPEVYIMHIVTLTVSSVAALPVLGKALGGKREDIESRQRAELLRMARAGLFETPKRSAV